MLQSRWKFTLRLNCNSFIGNEIVTRFCTCHDSTAVGACAKVCCDCYVRINVRARRNFRRIWIATENRLWNWPVEINKHHRTLVARHLSMKTSSSPPSACTGKMHPPWFVYMHARYHPDAPRTAWPSLVKFQRQCCPKHTQPVDLPFILYNQWRHRSHSINLTSTPQSGRIDKALRYSHRKPWLEMNEQQDASTNPSKWRHNFGSHVFTSAMIMRITAFALIQDGGRQSAEERSVITR